MPQYEHLDGHIEVTVPGSVRDRELAAHIDPPRKRRKAEADTADVEG